MSTRDKEILARLTLSITEAAQILALIRQNLNRAIASDRDALAVTHLARLHRHFIAQAGSSESSPEQAAEAKDRASILSSTVKEFYGVEIARAVVGGASGDVLEGGGMHTPLRASIMLAFEADAIWIFAIQLVSLLGNPAFRTVLEERLRKNPKFEIGMVTADTHSASRALAMVVKRVEAETNVLAKQRVALYRSGLVAVLPDVMYCFRKTSPTSTAPPMMAYEITDNPPLLSALSASSARKMNDWLFISGLDPFSPAHLTDSSDSFGIALSREQINS